MNKDVHRIIFIAALFISSKDQKENVRQKIG